LQQGDQEHDKRIEEEKSLPSSLSKKKITVQLESEIPFRARIQIILDGQWEAREGWGQNGAYPAFALMMI